MVDRRHPDQYQLCAIIVEFVIASGLIFVQSFLYEGLMQLRTVYEDKLRKQKGVITIKDQITKSGLFALGNLISLYLMMIFMTYNGVLCLSLVAGAFCGHLFFGVWMPAGEAERPRSCCS